MALARLSMIVVTTSSTSAKCVQRTARLDSTTKTVMDRLAMVSIVSRARTQRLASTTRLLEVQTPLQVVHERTATRLAQSENIGQTVNSKITLDHVSLVQQFRLVFSSLRTAVLLMTVNLKPAQLPTPHTVLWVMAFAHALSVRRVSACLIPKVGVVERTIVWQHNDFH